MRIWSRRLALGFVALTLAAGSWSPGARAEVAAVLAEDGSFLRTDIRSVQRGRLASVWFESDLVARRSNKDLGGERVLLNQSGALRADGTPSIAVHPLTGLPWAVWSFNEDGDYELAVSFFDGRFWSSPILLGNSGNGEADLQPQLQFTPDGRPLIAWWRMSPDGTEQSIWFTSRQNGTWIQPVRLSSTREKARRPTLLLDDDQLIVAFETDSGVRIRKFHADTPMIGGFLPAGGADGPDPPTYDDTRPPECQLIGCEGD
ncbi:MAG: hypothetical protein E2P00_04600 [Acidobacteria bacterium]|nr:MAG: hypothetical protein E2P03_07515 [Acidobacteriota bacterium]TDI44190.1 MAG: hypothetical protein E2P00_04600 [Acidobacteriota bacterium]